jgi:putative membrane protein
MQLESKLSKIIYVGCLTVFLTGLGSWAVLAHQDPATSRQSREEMKDTHFARAAALGGMAEIQLGKLAGARASNEVVKAFGERMVVQHGAAGDQLKAAAQKENITLPASPDSKEQQIYDRLARLSGSAFDRAYAKDMVEDHEKDLADFQNEANNGQDENIKAFAAQTIPMIQEHLNQARDMLKTVSQQTSGRRVGAHTSGR